MCCRRVVFFLTGVSGLWFQDIMRLATVIKREPEILFNLLFEDKDKEKEEPSLGSKVCEVEMKKTLAHEFRS